MSGGDSSYQRVFYVVLVATFVMNVMFVAYLVQIEDLVLDMTEIDGLFMLAMSSPPSTIVQQQIKGLPSRALYEAGWKVVALGNHNVIVHAAAAEIKTDEDRRRYSNQDEDYNSSSSILMSNLPNEGDGVS
jgi:ABC-type protease/lipase transport system fused ATPase/permease subunit